MKSSEVKRKLHDRRADKAGAYREQRASTEDGMPGNLRGVGYRLAIEIG